MTNAGTERMNSDATVKTRSDDLVLAGGGPGAEHDTDDVPTSEPMVISRRLTQIRRLTSSLTLPPFGDSPQSQCSTMSVSQVQ